MLPISRHEFRSGLRLTYLLRSFLKDVHSVASKFLSSRPGYLSGLLVENLSRDIDFIINDFLRLIKV